MFWLIFTAVDLYVGLIVLDSMKATLPPEKQARIAVVKKLLIFGLIVTAVLIVAKLIKLY